MSEHTDPRPAGDVAPDGLTITRRSLMQGIGVTGGLLAAGALPALLTALASTASASESTEGTATVDGIDHIVEDNVAINYPGRPVSYARPAGDQSWAMVIDVNGCIGCRRCVYACVLENNIGRDSGFTYIKILEMDLGSIHIEHAKLDYEQGGNPDKWYLPVQCMQCAKPTCVYGCPVKATWKEPDGIVVMDYDKCIACRNCIVTCPYGARHFNWVHPHVPENEINPDVPLEEKHGTVEKCHFCIQRTRNGGTTACTEACPVGARTFGDLRDPESAVSKILRSKRTFRLKEELGNEPLIWYVG
jgi:molybdopterin-containing oxidoreductase family iron-sulfur binding subunit